MARTKQTAPIKRRVFNQANNETVTVKPPPPPRSTTKHRKPKTKRTKRTSTGKVNAKTARTSAARVRIKTPRGDVYEKANHRTIYQGCAKKQKQLREANKKRSKGNKYLLPMGTKKICAGKKKQGFYGYVGWNGRSYGKTGRVPAKYLVKHHRR